MSETIAPADQVTVSYEKPPRVDVHGQLKPKLRGLVHAWSAVPVGICGLILLILTPSMHARWGVAIYVVSVTGMLTASACYHRLRVSDKASSYLRRLDHSMIGVAVAGTYTPVLWLCTDGATRATLIPVLWAGALLAMAMSFAWIKAPNFIRAALYTVLGFAGVLAMPAIFENGGVAPFVLIVIGGALYMIGAISYATRKPNIWPRVFGFHEVFHSFVVAAVVAHFVAVGLVVHATA